MPLINYALTILWILGITNAFNLMDNMDGLTGGLGAVASAFFLFFAFHAQQYVVGAIAAALLGSCLAFLVFNFNPASIFMGDAGSLFIGFLLALLGLKLRFLGAGTEVTWAIPMIVLGLPIFDTTLVVISRIRRGQPIWQGGKDHLSHRLAVFGLGPRHVAGILYGVACVLGITAYTIWRVGPSLGLAIVAVVLLAGIGLLIVCERKCSF
jgi:UDP-GlcNAc:undecaprenyl-phosphate GlcNAc-1-phosphate transferase